jgi:hypothetical protein
LGWLSESIIISESSCFRLFQQLCGHCRLQNEVADQKGSSHAFHAVKCRSSLGISPERFSCDHQDGFRIFCVYTRTDCEEKYPIGNGTRNTVVSPM